MRRSNAPPPLSAPLTTGDLAIDRLGACGVQSPLEVRDLLVDEGDAVLVHSDARDLAPYLSPGGELPFFEPAGARPRLFFDPSRVVAGVVTCGGLCPGVNDVIRSILLTLKFAYGTERLLGFRFGYSGLSREPSDPPLELSMERVRRIHDDGGTILGSSRGAPTVPEMVDSLVRHGVNMLFTVGGDGTLRGAAALAEEISARKLDIAVVGIPKTIDNDLHWVERTFGFATAVEEASRAISGAHVEAEGAFNGVGLVKLMGRHSGFIAAHASVANSDVNFCLVPEVTLALDGPAGFLGALETRLADSRHAVVVVAEGAGQDLVEAEAAGATDASGNLRLRDIGSFLKHRIEAHFSKRSIPLTLKYIDPSYIVRSLPANAYDSALCLMLGQHAVHAAMAGRTNLLIGYWNQRFTHVPLVLATRGRKELDPRGELWQAVLGATGQPARWS